MVRSVTSVEMELTCIELHLAWLAGCSDAVSYSIGLLVGF